MDYILKDILETRIENFQVTCTTTLDNETRRIYKSKIDILQSCLEEYDIAETIYALIERIIIIIRDTVGFPENKFELGCRIANLMSNEEYDMFEKYLRDNNINGNSYILDILNKYK